MVGLFKRKKTTRCGIYAIVNRTTGERYVGQSVDITKRWGVHRKDLDAGTHPSEGLQKVWENLGPGDFDFVVLKECRPEELDAFEHAFIQKKGEYNRDITVKLGMTDLAATMPPEKQANLVKNLKTITKTLDSMTEEERADFYAEYEAKADAEDEFFEAIQDMDDEELETIDRSTLSENMIEILDEEIDLRRA